MSKIYFEMNDKERQLNHIADNLDYAICMFGEGLSGTGQYNMSTEEIIELQHRIGDHLMAAYQDVYTLLKSTREMEDMLEDDTEEDTEEDEGISDIQTYPIKDSKGLSQVLNYQISNILETTNEETNKKGLFISLKKQVKDGKWQYRELILSGDGNKYISDEVIGEE